MARKQGTPLWVTCGCGCLLVVLLFLGAIGAAGFFGASFFKSYVEDMRDPASRAAKAGEILGTVQLPAGYSAQVFFRIPWVFDVVVLTDGPPAIIEDENDMELGADSMGEHLFVYLKLRKARMDEEEIEDMLRGHGSSEGVKADVGFEFDSDEELSRGEIQIDSQILKYAAHRGEVELDEADVPGIYSQVIIECPADELTRVAIWFQRVVDTGEEWSDLTGTPADETALRQFMAHFDVCVD